MIYLWQNLWLNEQVLGGSSVRYWRMIGFRFKPFCRWDSPFFSGTHESHESWTCASQAEVNHLRSVGWSSKYPWAIGIECWCNRILTEHFSGIRVTIPWPASTTAGREIQNMNQNLFGTSNGKSRAEQNGGLSTASVGFGAVFLVLENQRVQKRGRSGA